MAAVVLAGAPLEQSKAIEDGDEARVPAAQVRIFENGRFVGGGTLVASNWVLTSAHMFAIGSNIRHSMRFGVLDDSADGSDSTNSREIDRLVWHPRADLVMVHFAEPVPESTWIPDLTGRAGEDYEWVTAYGWGTGGHILKHLASTIIQAAAVENAENLRKVRPAFGNTFGGVPPMVTNHVTAPGDSGSGVFASNGTLLAVHKAKAPFYQLNDRGELYGKVRLAPYELPVWEFRDWIRSVIDGEGTSSRPPTDDERGRGLTEESGDDLPMTQPPRTDVCEPGEAGCTLPGPRWARSTLTGAGNYRGTALAVCAQAAGNTCSFDGTGHAGGAIARLSLGPSSAPGTAPRQVMVWCKTSAVFAEGASAQPALRVSFTNADRSEVPVGMGWWDVTPDQVGTGNTLVDPNQFATC